MRANPVTTTRRGLNLLKHQVHRLRAERGTVSSASVADFDAALASVGASHSTAFVHAGLSDIAAAFDADPYEFLYSRLAEQFETLVVPGFTEYFKVSGVYHKQHSRPKHGMFAKLFSRRHRDDRTDDAVKSLLLRGPHELDDCVHHDTYHPEGVFAELLADDVLVLNVGVPWLVCSHLHFLEARHDVPYMEKVTYDGYRLTDGRCESITQASHEYASAWYSFNRPRIKRVLDRHDALERFDFGGMRLYAFTLGDLDRYVGRKVADDPYFLVTA